MNQPSGLGVLRQDIRNFTVQIRHGVAEDVILGTGFVVSPGGIVVTCAHVVRAAGIDPRLDDSTTVRVYFPRRGGWSAELRTASIVASFAETDDDVVCLQVHGALPLPLNRVAILGTAERSRWHAFESYGYRRLAKYTCGLTRGQILGEVEPPEEFNLLADPVQLESSQINSGMSGAAVLDLDHNLVVGLVSETWVPEFDSKDRDTAWAVNASVLHFTDLGIEIRQNPLPLRRAQQPVLDPGLTVETVPIPGHRLDDAPSPLPEWIGRDRLQEILGAEWRSPDRLVVGLIGFGGEGKSSVARRWVDKLLAGGGADAPAGVFWWNFAERGSADEFLEAALEFMSGGRITSDEVTETGSRVAFAAGLLRTRRYLFILDGLEAVQFQSGDQYGSITSPDLREFLGYYATPGHQSFCVLTSRAPVLDLAPYVTYRHVDVLPLKLSSGCQLLRKLGVLGAEAALEQVVRDWAGHALTLSLLAAYLVKKHGGDIRRVSRIPPPTAGLPRDEMVRRVLLEYDQCLSDGERTFLRRFSVFRRAVADAGLRIVEKGLDLAGDGEARSYVFKHLVAARILPVGRGRAARHAPADPRLLRSAG